MQIDIYNASLSGNVLMMHNGRLANPLDVYTKQLKSLTSKRKKTEEDLFEISRVEFQGGLYYNDDAGRVEIPATVLHSLLVAGARKDKNGQLVEAGLRIVDTGYPLIYKGPKDRDGLWNDKRFVDFRGVGVNQSRVMRTRPIFNDWKLDFQVMTFPEVVDGNTVKLAIERAGLLVGIGEMRPQMGNFNLVNFELAKIPLREVA